MNVQLNDDVLRSFKTGRIFKTNQGAINSLDFHRSADLLATAAADDKIIVYDIAEGRQLATVPSNKYGCAQVTWTHAPNQVIFASNKGDDHAVRHLVIGQGGAGRGSQFKNYFKGHSGRVTTLAMSPKADCFISAGQDKEVRLWDLRTPQCQAILHAPAHPTVAFDQQGLVFAVGLDNGVIKLYDPAHYEQGPFETFVVPDLKQSPVPFARLAFSNDGKLLLAVAEGKAYVLDAFSGGLLRAFSNGVPEAGMPPEASLSYDGQYVLTGCEDRSLRAYSVRTGELVATWTGQIGRAHV